MDSDRAAETRRQIVAAALTLLRRHGEQKLTVVDIARSLGMSHANVYRFFSNRTEILDALIDDWMAKIQSFMQEVAGRPGTAATRIQAVLLELHRRRRQKRIDDPEVFQTVQRVFDLQPAALSRHRDAIRTVFRQILEDGIASGEFRRLDLDEAVEILLDSTVLFLHPLMIPTLMQASADEAEKRAERVVSAILQSFRETCILQQSAVS